MAKILIVGMTAPQSSRRLNSRSKSFAGAVTEILESVGHQVTWDYPSIHAHRSTYDKYDVLFAGVAPLLSVTANKAYGVLNFIDLFSSDQRLKFFVDSPNIASIDANLRAIHKDRARLFSAFYALRKEYEATLIDNKKKTAVLSAVEFLSQEEWPTTLIPASPWFDLKKTAAKLPKSSNAEEVCVGVNVDSYYVSSRLQLRSKDTVRRWAVDTDSTKWCKSTLSTLVLPHVHMKSKKAKTDLDVQETINSSFGALISPHDDGTIPWSYRWIQCLNAGIPVVSDWKITSSLGQSWSHLAAGVEEMDEISRYELSVSQRVDYVDAVPSKDKVTVQLTKALEI